ncbi:MAG: glycosyltransferase family 2 protein [Planctomycetota bacterium]
MGSPRLAYILVTHNRRARLLQTLRHLQQHTPFPTDQYETWVVDNGSTDGTPAAIAQLFPNTHLIALRRNQGVWARTLAMRQTQADYLVLLDDDSYPIGNAIPDALATLDAHPHLAGIMGRCLLPNGNEEACALPAVMLSGAVILRRTALIPTTLKPRGSHPWAPRPQNHNTPLGFRREFFRKAGEYDLSFRLWNLNRPLLRDESITFRHDKHAAGRSTALALRMDLRNNLILAHRFLHGEARRAYRHDWLQRYAAIALHQNHEAAAHRALREARRFRKTPRETLTPQAFETLFAWKTTQQQVRAWANTHHIQRVALIDFAKNTYAAYRACRQLQLSITAVADNGPAFQHRTYRHAPILQDADALANQPDGLILTNVNPAQAPTRLAQLQALTDRPILSLDHTPPFKAAALTKAAA